jgi:hypothetical protein
VSAAGIDSSIINVDFLRPGSSSMKRSKFKAILRLLVLLAIATPWDLRAAVPPGYPPPDEGRAPAKSKPDLEAQVFAKYRKWTRANSAPVKVAGVVAAACAPTPLPGPQANQAADPHADKLINVFVNKIGRTAMLAEKKPQFPEGAIIVKERLPLKKSSASEWLMAMVKREEGFNPAAGDWEFFVLRTPEKVVIERGRIENCQACHARAKETDFVFRHYLTRQAQAKLR